MLKGEAAAIYSLSMTLDILATAQLSAVIVLVAYAFINKRKPSKPSYPPQIPSFFPWIGSLVGFNYRRGEFLMNCM